MRFPLYLKSTASSVLWFSPHCILASAHIPLITCCYCLPLPSSSSSLQCQMRVLHHNQSSKQELHSEPFFFFFFFFGSQNKAEYVFLLSSLLLHDFNLTSTNQWLWNMARYWAIRRKSSNMWNENTKKNLRPLFENNLWWRLRNNEELCELLGGHGMVEYIQKITMSWSYAWYIWIILEHWKSIEWKILWKKTCGKTESGGTPSCCWIYSVRARRRLVEDRTIWRWPIEDARAWCWPFHHWSISVQYCNKARQFKDCIWSFQSWSAFPVCYRHMRKIYLYCTHSHFIPFLLSHRWQWVWILYS